MKYSIRRHLGKGKHFGHFQIREAISDAKQGEVVGYVNPDTHSLIMANCLLHNKVNQSTKIFEGEHKKPCAWIVTDDLQIVSKDDAMVNYEFDAESVSFNPKVDPSWIVNGRKMDGFIIPLIITKGTKLFKI